MTFLPTDSLRLVRLALPKEKFVPPARRHVELSVGMNE
jgi:hypothetical protein